jgi:magnesium-protoporphyrin IX monomethyl ester (oxidative) cyclase
MEHLINKFGIEELKFEDDNLLANPKRAKQIFKGMIERKFNLHWNMPNGVWIKALEDEELLDLMKKSGCYEVILAFESGDQYVVDNIINKPLDLEKARTITKKVKDYGIDAHAFFIIGFPGETKAQIENTLNYAKSLPLDKVYIFTFNPLPGTPLYEEAIAKGFFKQENLYNENYSLFGLTTPEFNPYILNKLRYKVYWYITMRTLWRDPLKFFMKYTRRVLRPQMLKTLIRIAHSLPIFFTKKISDNKTSSIPI